MLHNAHHLRELAGIAEATGQDWPTKLADLLVQIHVAVHSSKADGKNKLSPQSLSSYRRRYNELVADGQRQNPPPPPTGKRGRPALGPAGSLLRRLQVYADDVLRFATDFRVPFDNNQAERDVRMVKLQQKISGGWRSRAGATAFLDVRSYLSTARKHNRAGLDVLRDLFTGNAWIPALTGPAP
ncbi:MAG: IS66 family transposase [Solirubrobacterales bacterium]